MGGFEPLKISFFLRTPLILGWPWIHFDALIAHTLLREELGEQYYTLPSKKAEELVVDILEEKMPIEKTIHNDYELWHASVSFFEDKVIGGVTIYKRFCTRTIGLAKSKKKRVDIVRGYYKSFAMRLPLIITKRVDFYTYGVEDEIEEIVRHIPALGKKRVYGFGDIKSYEIIKLNTDCSIMMNNVVMRPIPVEALKHIKPRKIDISSVAYKPPYWWKENVAKCILPGSRLEEYAFY